MNGINMAIHLWGLKLKEGKNLFVSLGPQLRRVSLNFRVLEEQCNILFIAFFEGKVDT